MKSILTRTSFLVLAALSAIGAGSSAIAATEQQKQQAIDDGLVWLISQQQVSGDEGYWNYENTGTLAATAACALAFIEEDHLPGENVTIGGVEYGDVVGRAVTYIFNRAQADARFGVESAVYERYAEDYDNDGVYNDGNDLAVYFEPGADNRRLYTTGICIPVVFYLGQALGPDATIAWGSAVVNGRTYREVLQDLVDWIVFAQVEPNLGNYRGGWRYDANWSSSDNSTAQWGALPLLFADGWGLGTPDFVYEELELWVNYIQNANGGSGYDSPNNMVNISKTGGLLLELAAIGVGVGDPRVDAALGYLDAHWNENVNGWDGNFNNAYAMWAIEKSLWVQGLSGTIVSAGNTVYVGNGLDNAVGGYVIGNEGDTYLSAEDDWLSHYCQYLVDIQNANGSWSGAASWTGALATAWYINILNALPVEGIADPDIQITSILEPGQDCAWFNDVITHEVHYWFGTPGFPDPDVMPAEDVEVTITLSEHLDFVSATGDWQQDPGNPHVIRWFEDTIPDGEESFQSIVTTVAGTIEPQVELVTVATISASNVDPDLWDVNESRVTTCDPGCINVRVGDVVFDGDAMHLTVPLEIDNVLEAEGPVYAADVVFSFDPAVIDFADITYGGTVLEGLGWSQLWNVMEPGELCLGLAGTTALPDDGVLVFLEFDVALDAPCDGCTLLTPTVVFNEGVPCAEVAPSEPWCLPLASVVGNITYWGCGMLGNDHPPIPLCDVVITDGDHVDQAVTDEEGAFLLEGCHDECYTLTPTREAGEVAGISALDAALVLRHVVGLDDLTACPIEPMVMQDGTMCPAEDVMAQQVAADVTGNGEVHSYDAAMILAYVVGQPLPDGMLVGQWSFYCPERTVCLDDDVTTGMDFVGLLHGDVSGSWGLMARDESRSPSTTRLAIGSASGAPGGLVEVPVMVRAADGFLGLVLDIGDDLGLLTPESVTPGSLAEGRLLQWSVKDGQLRVAIAGATPLDGSGHLFTVGFRVAENPGTPEILVRATEAYVDEQTVPLSEAGGWVALTSTAAPDATLPTTYQLHGAMPNPFNPRTVIAFDVPVGGGTVDVRIYDVTGRLVCTLQSGHLGAGRHQVVWDGDDLAGRRVASGTYFCRMEAGAFTATRSLVLLK